LNDLLALVDQLEKPEQSKPDRAIDLYALGHEIVNLQHTRGHLTRTVTDCDQRLIRDITSFLQDPSPSHLLVAKGASKKGYDSCLHALAGVDPNSPAADHIHPVWPVLLSFGTDSTSNHLSWNTLPKVSGNPLRR